jgi:cytochrome c5
MAAPDIPPHTSPIRTPKQLVIAVVLAFVVPITLILALAYLVTSGPRPAPDSVALSPEKVAERIRPVAEVSLGASAGGAQSARSGEEVYKTVCTACHAAGIQGAPKFGNRGDWAPRVKAGEKALLQSALKGKGAMPPKGGAADLSDLELERAVVYMANAGGAGFKEPAGAAAKGGAPASQTAQAQPASAAHEDHGAAPAQPAAAAKATKTSAKADGKKVFEGTCVVCHGTGVAGAPKFGDKAAWAPHLAHGVAELYNSALKGKNAMPPKGGNMTLSDDEVKAAVDYMASAAK